MQHRLETFSSSCWMSERRQNRSITDGQTRLQTAVLLDAFILRVLLMKFSDHLAAVIRGVA